MPPRDRATPASARAEREPRPVGPRGAVRTEARTPRRRPGRCTRSARPATATPSRARRSRLPELPTYRTPSADGAIDRAPVERPQPAPPRRRKQQPGPGQASPRTGTASRQHEPVDARARRPAARTATPTRSPRRRPGSGRPRPGGGDPSARRLAARRSARRLPGTAAMARRARHPGRPRATMTHYTCPVSDITEAAVARRVPSLTDERLRVLSRRQPVTVPPGTSPGRLRPRHPAHRDGRFGVRLRRRAAA